MSVIKKYRNVNVLEAAEQRVRTVFDTFERVYLSFSAGKDSFVMLHLVAAEARRRGRRFGLLLLDLEAQYRSTIDAAAAGFQEYADCTDPFWVALPIALRNAVSNFEPKWLAWDPNQRARWVREPHPSSIVDSNFFPFFQSGMEFEEFVPLFGEWYSGGTPTACLVGIRTDESLNRFRSIAEKGKARLRDYSWTTLVSPNVYNCYPIYDWAVSDIWHWHALNPTAAYNRVYDLMHRAGLAPSQMRICQPYGDDQRKGLWLYHVLEPQTWYRVVARVSGANSGATYIQEQGNVTGYNQITKPVGHTWKSFCNLLLSTLPPPTRDHYLRKFKKFVRWWRKRGYPTDLPDEAPRVLEVERMAPSWRRLCKVLLRNDYWCKGLAFTQPKSAAYDRYLELKKAKTLLAAPKSESEDE